MVGMMATTLLPCDVKAADLRDDTRTIVSESSEQTLDVDTSETREKQEASSGEQSESTFSYEKITENSVKVNSEVAEKTTEVTTEEKSVATENETKKTTVDDVKKSAIKKQDAESDGSEKKAIETKISMDIAFASGDQKPAQYKEIFRENEQESVVYYLNGNAKVIIHITDKEYEGAVANIGVRVNGGEIQWEQTELKTENTVISKDYSNAGKYQVYVWVKEANGDVTGKDAQTGEVNAAGITRFVIDKIAPKMELGGVDNGKITNQSVSLLLTAEEENPNWNSFQLQVKRVVEKNQEEEILKLKKEDWKQGKEESMQQSVVFEKEGRYEITLEGKDKANNEAEKRTISFTVDKTAPVISNVVYYNGAEAIAQRFDNVYGNDIIVVEVMAEDSLSGINDDQVYVTIGSDVSLVNAKTFAARKLPGSRYCVIVPKDLGVDNFNDKIIVWVSDKAGNKKYHTTAQLIVSSSKPNVTFDSDMDPDVWTKQNFPFQINVTDSVAGLKEIVYKINDKRVKKVEFDQLTFNYSCDLVAKESADVKAGYNITVEATNNCGNTRIFNKAIHIDKVKPEITLSGVNNGAFYNAAQTIHAEIVEKPSNGSVTKFYVQREYEGKKTTVALKKFKAKKERSSCDRRVEEDGKYTVYAVTKDKAGNKKKSNTLEFTIDKTAPKLEILGVSDGQSGTEAVDVTFRCEETYYETNEVNVEVERVLNGNSVSEKVGKFENKGKVSDLQQHFSEDGIYHVRMSAKDKAGNTAETKEVTFTIDGTKPAIYISGTENYELWKQSPEVLFGVEENFYTNMKVRLSGTRTDIDGNVTELEFPEYPCNAAVSSLTQKFDEEGIYAIEMEAEDAAGNSDRSEIHFTVDRSKPVIEGVNQYNGGYYQEVVIGDSLDGMFKDLTILKYHILLNGIEYDGAPIKTEGKYTLDVEATDELDHKNSQMIEFIIDRTEPKIIFSGVKNGEIVKEKGVVSFDLVEDEDEITSVRMNGEEFSTATRELEFSEYGDYVIEVESVDKAGNIGQKTLEFKYKNPRKGLFAVGGVGAIGLLAGIWAYLMSLKKRKEVK